MKRVRRIGKNSEVPRKVGHKILRGAQGKRRFVKMLKHRRSEKKGGKMLKHNRGGLMVGHRLRSGRNVPKLESKLRHGRSHPLKIKKHGKGLMTYKEFNTKRNWYIKSVSPKKKHIEYTKLYSKPRVTMPKAPRAPRLVRRHAYGRGAKKTVSAVKRKMKDSRMRYTDFKHWRPTFRSYSSDLKGAIKRLATQQGQESYDEDQIIRALPEVFANK